MDTHSIALERRASALSATVADDLEWRFAFRAGWDAGSEHLTFDRDAAFDRSGETNRIAFNDGWQAREDFDTSRRIRHQHRVATAAPHGSSASTDPAGRVSAAPDDHGTQWPLPRPWPDPRPRRTTITPHVEPAPTSASAGTTWTFDRFRWTVLPPLVMTVAVSLIRFL